MPRSKYYNILGLPNNATETEVRKRYRKLVMEYHPDRNDTPEANEKFLIVTLAYEILVGKRSAPATTASRSTQRHPAANEAEDLRQKQQRAQEARARYQQYQREENLENERYYQKMTNGVKWKTIQFTSILGLVLSLMIISDYILPHHYSEDKVVGYNLNYAHGLGGKQISLIKTGQDDFYWVDRITYDLYGRNYPIYVETTWFCHNSIRVVAQGKISNIPYNLNFNWYRISWLLVILFMIPTFTMYYKRRKISFTVLYQLSYYGINALMLVYLISDNRWAHVLTFGVL